MDNKRNNELPRREFLKFAGISLLGVSFSRNAIGSPQRNRQGELLLYVGTYTTGKSEGIYVYRFDPHSGKLTHLTTVRDVVDPSFLTISPDRRFLYAVNETEEFEGKKSGAVSAFAIDQRSGDLRFLNQRASMGGSPCYVDVDLKGRFVLVANYGGGNVSVLPVKRDGSLGAVTESKQHEGSSANKERQAGPHAHCIMLDTANRFAYSCDLGTDKIMIYRFDARSGRLIPNHQPYFQVKPGSGPRHLAFHPKGTFIFVLNELLSTVGSFARDPKNGTLTELQTLSTLPNDFTGDNSGADIHVSPDGRFLYCSNRGHDSIAVFSVNTGNGQLAAVGHTPTGGMTPRNFNLDPSGRFLLAANQRSDSIVVFRRDQRSGQLSVTGNEVTVPSPVCLKFMRLS